MIPVAEFDWLLGRAGHDPAPRDPTEGRRPPGGEHFQTKGRTTK
jgi:hypothetical protein